MLILKFIMMGDFIQNEDVSDAKKNYEVNCLEEGKKCIE